MKPLFLKALAGETTERPPIWFMRQAGRYLPEYRELRTRAENFVAFCLNPEMAAEATLQPMRRFPFDAAIVFADILLICEALGQDLWFEVGEGPKLGPLPAVAAMRERVAAISVALSPVGETLTRVRSALEPERALIGFCGAPWTVACYMLDGHGSQERSAARRFIYEDPQTVDALLDVLVDASAQYLAMQARAGADALQLFESWAEGLPDELFERLVIGPQARLIERVRELGVTVPIIGFPRGAGASYPAYAAAVDTQGLGLDTSVPLAVGKSLQGSRTIQGALDPLLLRAGGPALERRIDDLQEAWGSGPWIFNLGHGILPDTPIAHVQAALKRVTGA
jgi:uroporphyrinogen decarboxylase